MGRKKYGFVLVVMGTVPCKQVIVHCQLALQESKMNAKRTVNPQKQGVRPAALGWPLLRLLPQVGAMNLRMDAKAHGVLLGRC